MSAFKKATRKQIKLKLAITGPSGSGKTYSALRLATGMANGGKIAYLDTENGSASLYSDKFDFDVLDINRPYDDEKFVNGINLAVSEGYSIVVIDSASHFWEGILEYKSKLDERGGNSYTNWNNAGQKFNDIIRAVLQSDIHIILCLRSKMDYVLQENAKGKQVPKKVGMAPIMRDGIEYEFTTVFDVAMNHEAETSKDRSNLFTDKIFQITEDTGREILAWLDSGEKDEITDAQKEKIEDLFTFGGFTPERIQKVLDWAGVTSIDSLTGTKAESVIKQVEKTVQWENGKEEKKGAAA